MKAGILLTTFIVVLLFGSAFSQTTDKPAYIVKQQDTIYGVGHVGKNQQYIQFKRADATNFRKILPEQIDAFRIIGGRYFISYQVVEYKGKLNWYFLELLVDGEIDLYSISKYARFFIQKNDGKLVELKDNVENITSIAGSKYLKKDKRYLGVIKLYMEDAPALLPEIDKMDRLQQADLVKLAVDYHKAVCTDHECVNYTKDVPKVTYKLEILSGANHHNISYTPQFGVLVYVWRPLHNERLYLKTGLIYSARSYGRTEYTYPEKIVYNLKIPFSFEYVFGKKAFKPTLAIGFPTGMYPIVSVQGGFIVSVTPGFELSLSASLDGILSQMAGMQKELYNNNFGHSVNFGLIFDFK
ncbi:MAG: hypothetical protein ACOYN4_18415 [Bacteroidales bacterium]